jgi:hypothetical protein
MCDDLLSRGVCGTNNATIMDCCFARAQDQSSRITIKENNDEREKEPDFIYRNASSLSRGGSH